MNNHGAQFVSGRPLIGIEMMLGYRIELTPDDNDTFLVTCP
jgi:hypothetical protein